jgi:hypothetical protein
MVIQFRARLFVVLAVLACAMATSACTTKLTNLDPGAGIPVPLCPQRIQLTLFATGGFVGFPSCGGFAGNMTYPVMTAGTDTDVLMASNVDAANANRTPTPTAVLWIVDIQPAADFTLASAPTLTMIVPSAYATSAFTYYYCIKDVTAGSPVAPVGTLGVLQNSTVLFPSVGPWGPFVANHNYLIRFYGV